MDLRLATFLLVAILLVLAGCKTDSSQAAQAEGPAPDEKTARAQPAEPAEPVPAAEPTPRSLNLVGTPYDEELTDVSIVWKAPAEKIGLQKTAGASAERFATFEAAPGRPVPFEKSLVIVTEPRPMTAKKEVKISANPYGPATGKLDEPQSLVIEEGEQIFLYKYAGEGTCYFGYRETIFLGTCPSGMMFRAEGWTGGKPTPLESSWWVRVEAPKGAGWWKVDEAKIDVKTEFTGEQ